jgi:RimJ/RimL family protein N-acetyltransferase
MIVELRSQRLRGEPLTMAHRDALQRMHDDPLGMAMLGGVRTPAETQAYLERNVGHWERYGYGVWMLREMGSNAMVGRAVLRHLDLDGVDEVEVGYGFYPAYWGKGLATEICRACIAAGREQVGLGSMVALTLPANQASQHVMRKSGMVFERDLEHGGTPHVLFRTIPWPA